MHTDLHSGTPDPAEAAVLRATLGALLRRLRREAGVSTRALAVLLVEEGLRLDEAALAPRHPLADPTPP